MPRQIIDAHHFLFQGNNYLDVKEYVKAKRKPYTIERSNYTMRFISGSIDITFIETKQPNIVFAAYNKIKADIKLKGLEPPDINTDEIAYFNFNIPNKLLGVNFPVIYNTDIKSAYSSVLINHKIIQPDTIKLISHIPKLNRLVSVGMLASKKKIEEYSESCELINYSTNQNPLANFFFLCVHETGRYINACEKEIGDDFIFSWVDGIYYFSQANAKKISSVLMGFGLKFTHKAYYDFTVNKTFSGAKKVTFRDEPGGVFKTFLLPEKRTNENEVIKLLKLHS